MIMTEAQKEIFRNWLRDKRLKDTCPMCGNRTWQPGEIVCSPVMDAVSNQISLAPANMMPVVQVVCTNCCYVLQFAAKPIGLVG